MNCADRKKVYERGPPCGSELIGCSHRPSPAHRDCDPATRRPPPTCDRHAVFADQRKLDLSNPWTAAALGRPNIGTTRWAGPEFKAPRQHGPCGRNR